MQQVDEQCQTMCEKAAQTLKTDAQTCCGNLIYSVLTTKTPAGAARRYSLKPSSGTSAALWSLTWRFCVFSGVSEPLRGAMWHPRVRQVVSSKPPREHTKGAAMLPKQSKAEPLGPQCQQRKPIELQRYPHGQKTVKKLQNLIKIRRKSLSLTSVT